MSRKRDVYNVEKEEERSEGKKKKEKQRIRREENQILFEEIITGKKIE